MASLFFVFVATDTNVDTLDEAYSFFFASKLKMFTISLLALLLSAWGALLILKRLQVSINLLVAATQRVSSGDYGEDVPTEKNEKDEICILVESFNVMQHEIADREERILYQIHHDALTGLSNRALVSKEIKSLICDYNNTTQDQDEGSEQCFAVIGLNINRFKQVNSTFGYKTGDKLLQAIAHRITTLLAEDSYPARIGGDEFLVLIKNTSEVELPGIIGHFLTELNQTYHIGYFDITISVCAGVSIFPQHGMRTSQLLRRADIALNNAKQRKKSIEFYEVGEDEKYLNQIRLISDLKQAMIDNQLVMYYQPKLDLKKRRITQVEALVRWFHKEQGFISPEVFIGLAEQSGLMPDLTRWILKAVFQEVKAWKNEGVDIEVAVNLSAHDLAHDDLPNYVDELLRVSDIAPENLILEVTESAVMEDPDKAMSILHRFKASGIKLAIDDYGTGYSSLGQLKSMPVDELKIDMSFVLNLERDADDQIIVKSTIEMGHNIGLTIVAEGVESKAAWGLLELYGCDKLQGYYISKPQPSEDFVKWYKGYSID